MYRRSVSATWPGIWVGERANCALRGRAIEDMNVSGVEIPLQENAEIMATSAMPTLLESRFRPEFRQLAPRRST